MTVRIKQDHRSRQALIEIDIHDDQFRRGISQGLQDVGVIVQGEVRRSILQGPKTGHFYLRPGGRIHQASAPGEAPANETGKLLTSVDFKVTGWEQMEIGDRAGYGVYLELGTRKMEPRPHLETAVKRTGTLAQRVLEDAVSSRIG